MYVYSHLYLCVHLYLSIYLCRSMLWYKVTIYSCRISSLLTYFHRRCVESLWHARVEQKRLPHPGATGKRKNGWKLLLFFSNKCFFSQNKWAIITLGCVFWLVGWLVDCFQFAKLVSLFWCVEASWPW